MSQSSISVFLSLSAQFEPRPNFQVSSVMDLCFEAAKDNMQWKSAVITISFIIPQTSEPLEIFNKHQKFQVNSRHLQKIRYKTKVFSRTTLKQSVNDS